MTGIRDNGSSLGFVHAGAQKRAKPLYTDPYKAATA